MTIRGVGRPKLHPSQKLPRSRNFRLNRANDVALTSAHQILSAAAGDGIFARNNIANIALAIGLAYLQDKHYVQTIVEGIPQTKGKEAHELEGANYAEESQETIEEESEEPTDTATGTRSIRFIGDIE